MTQLWQLRSKFQKLIKCFKYYNNIGCIKRSDLFTFFTTSKKIQFREKAYEISTTDPKDNAVIKTMENRFIMQLEKKYLELNKQ